MKWCKAAIPLIAILLMFFSVSCNTSKIIFNESEYGVNMDTLITAANTASSMYSGPMRQVAQKGFLCMWADTQTGHFIIEDLRNGHLWHSTPDNAESDEIAQGILRTVQMSQITVTAVDPETSSIGIYTSRSCELNGSIFVQAVDNGINVIYTFQDEGFAIPVAYRLLDDSLRIQIDAEKIIESKKLRLLSITVLPMFGAQEQKTDGYFVLANGSGSIMNFNTKKPNTMPFEAKVYGDDPVYQQEREVLIKENYSLPVFGLQTAKNGLLAFADMGAANASVKAASAGQESMFNKASFTFTLRGYQTIFIGDKSTWNYKDVVTFEKGKIKTGRIGIRYFFLDQNQRGPAAMAGVIRSYLRKNPDFKPQSMSDTAPVFLTVLGAIKRPASTLGILYQKTEPMTTFNQAADISNALKEVGVSGQIMIYDNWSNAELNGKITALFDPLRALGGKRGLKALQETLGGMGGKLFLNAQTIQFTKSGNGVSVITSGIKNINETPVETPTYKANTQYPDPKAPKGRLLNASASAASIKNLVNSLPEKMPVGVNLAAMSNTVYTDFGKTGLRRQAAENVLRQAVRQITDRRLVGDNPNFYVMAALSGAVNIPTRHTAYDCLDESIPFYQMVLHGMIPYGSRAINSYGDFEDMFLQCMETGSAPHYELVWTAGRYLSMNNRERYYGGFFETVKDTIARQYSRYRELYDATASVPIVGYEQIAQRVVKTVYENGVATLVNRSDEEVVVNGVVVGKKDFVIIREEQ